MAIWKPPIWGFGTPIMSRYKYLYTHARAREGPNPLFGTPIWDPLWDPLLEGSPLWDRGYGVSGVLQMGPHLGPHLGPLLETWYRLLHPDSHLAEDAKP